MSTSYSLTSKSLPKPHSIVGFHCSEHLSRPYRLDVAVRVPHAADFDFGDLLGDRATFAAPDPKGVPFLWHGRIAAIELEREYPDSSLFLITIEPQMAHLAGSFHSRIFTQASIPEIVTAVLQHAGVTRFGMRLKEKYKQREHVCQYRESDLAFIDRLLEREGMYYFFEQGEEHERLVIVDHRSSHVPLSPAPYRYYPGDSADASMGAAIQVFRCRMTSLPKEVGLKDYDYTNPNLKLSATAPVDEAGNGSVVHYGENFSTPAEATHYASIRAEELKARRRLFFGRATAHHLRSGYTFVLEEHPRAAFNSEYLAVEVVHSGAIAGAPEEVAELLDIEHGDAYRAEVQAIPAKTQLRAERRTPWPRVHGVVDGVVDGSAGSPYAQIDAHGRYKVRLFFDESDLIDGSASTWVRMLQPHGGSVEGFHFPLRKGTEVHVVFLGGDPDRPVIAGVAHNAQKPSAVTVHNHTMNVIQTGGSNRIELDDVDGAQYVKIACPKLTSYLHLGNGPYALVAHTVGNGWISIGGNLDVDVCGDMTEEVTGTVDIRYESTLDVQVQGAVTELYKTSLSTTVDGPVDIVYTGPLVKAVDGIVAKSYQSAYMHSVVGPTIWSHASMYQKSVNGMAIESFNASHLVDVTGISSLTVHGPHIETVDGPYSLTTGGSLDIKACGPITINTPKMTVNALTWSRLDSVVESVKAVEKRVTDELSEVKKSSFAVTGVNAELNGIAFAAGGANISMYDFESEKKSLKLLALGIRLQTSGPNIRFEAIAIFA